MNPRRKFLLVALTAMRQALKLLLNWPNIHTQPSRTAALKMLGFTASMPSSPDDATHILPTIGNPGDETHVLPPISGSDTLEAVQLEYAYRRVMNGNDEELKRLVLRRIARARRNIQQRSRERASSMTATLVFIGFLVGTQVAIIIASLPSDLKTATKPTIVGLLVIFWGVCPMFGHLAPRHRGDEGVEAIANSEFDWLCEDVGRSSAQRSQLWRLWVAMAISLACTAVTLLLFLLA